MSKKHSKSQNPMMSANKAKNFKVSMGKLLRYLKPYYPLIAIAVIFSAISTILTILATDYIRRISNEIAVKMFNIDINLDKVSSLAMILVIFYSTSFVCAYIQALIMNRVTQGTSKRFRKEISAKINRLPLKYFDSRSYGDILSRVTNDIDTMSESLNQSVSAFVSSIIMLIGVLIMMFITSWQMALTAIITIPLSFALMVFVVMISQKYFIAQQKYLGSLNGIIEETYSGHNVVKAFNAEIKKQKEYDDINEKLAHNAFRAQALSGTIFPIYNLISNIGYVAICVVGCLLFIKDQISVGVITSFFIYVKLFQNPIATLGQSASILQSTAAAAERVFEFLEEQEQVSEEEKTTIVSSVKGKVEFKNIKFGYNPDKTIIHDFSATVLPGQKVAIVGPTGAGKTTMVNLLMRFYEANSGDILIDGVKISDMKRETVRDMFSMVLQDTWLFDGTIRDNVVYSKKNVTEEDIVKACKAANVHHYIETLPNGYDMVLDDDCNISSGQRQLLTIARAMIQNSPMMILDEATSNVDTRTEELIQNAMDNLTKGRTSFVIAHRLSTIKNADLILVMRDGNIVEQGNHEELLAQNGFYAELYNSQFEEKEL